jgi:hypothetical protein
LTISFESILSMGKDIISRVKETKRLKKKPAIEVINKIFNPNEKFTNRIAEQNNKLFEIYDML